MTILAVSYCRCLGNLSSRTQTQMHRCDTVYDGSIKRFVLEAQLIQLIFDCQICFLLATLVGNSLPFTVQRLPFIVQHTRTHTDTCTEQCMVHRPRAQRRFSLICLCPRRTSEFQRLKLTFVAGQTLGPSDFVVGHQQQQLPLCGLSFDCRERVSQREKLRERATSWKWNVFRLASFRSSCGSFAS